MKNQFLRDKFFCAWIFFHAGIALFFLANFFCARGNMKIDSDLFNMLPKNFSEKSISRADEKLTELTGQSVLILAGSENFQDAKSAAEKVYVRLNGSKNFKSIFLYADTSSFSEISEFVFKYRWNLLPENSVQEINSDGGKIFARNSLAMAFSPFSILPLEKISDDPFMLSERALQNYLDASRSSGTALFAKDGVLAGKNENRWYVMIRGNLSREGAALASRKNGVAEIYAACLPLEKNGIRFVFSGTPFHSYKSSNSASKEISVISSVSFLAVALILLFVFKSPLPVCVSIFSVCVSILSAFALTLAAFKKLHVLTLVFGTSLIGSCIDYSLHFFVHWKSGGTKSAKEIRGILLPKLSLSFASTAACFLILFFAPFGLLKQIAIFSAAGITSSFLTVAGVYPFIPLPPENFRGMNFPDFLNFSKFFGRKKIRRILIFCSVAIFIFAFVFFRGEFKIQNDLSRLYTQEGRVLQDEIESAKVTKYFPSGWFILRGKTQEELLQREENFCAQLKSSMGEKTPGLLCTSIFIPSKARQEKSRNASQKLLDSAQEQFEFLGFDSAQEDAERLRENFFASSAEFVTMESAPDFLADSVSSAWLGEIDGEFYSVVLPSHVDDENFFRGISDGDDNIFFVGKMKDISRDLDSLTKTILKLFAAAYVLLFVFLNFFFTKKESLKIVSIPILIVASVCTIFGFLKIHLEFFSITGMILVFGLGLDYVIYMTQGRSRNSADEKLEPFAILLSYATTAISFGALALSSFKPVQLIGLSVFVGLTAAWIFSLCLGKSE
jgi:predicted exporter